MDSAQWNGQGAKHVPDDVQNERNSCSLNKSHLRNRKIQDENFITQPITSSASARLASLRRFSKGKGNNINGRFDTTKFFMNIVHCSLVQFMEVHVSNPYFHELSEGSLTAIYKIPESLHCVTLWF